MLQRKRLILNTPSSKVRSAAMGLVEINGLAIGPYTMPAPITAVPCYYYRTMACRWERRGKSSEWVKVADESLHVPFYLDDNTGRVLVDPRGAEMDIHRDFHEEYSHSLFSTHIEVPATVSGFLARHAISTDNKIKIDEYCIKPKNALFILGTLAENPGLDVGAEDSRTNLMGAVDNPDFKSTAAGASAGIAGTGTSSVAATGRHSDAPPTEQEIKARATFAAAMGFHMPGSLQASLLPLTHSAAPHPAIGSPANSE